jgi:retinoid hydroxylase
MKSKKSTFANPLPPGNFGLPIIGETIGFFRDPNFAKKRYQKYGKIFKSRIFGSPTIFVSGAEANYFLLINENKYFTSTWPKSTTILLGNNSLSTQTGDLHGQRRKLMFQAFQPRALASYIPTIESFTKIYLDRWQSQKNLIWYPEIRNYTFDIACHLFVGTDNGSSSSLCELFEDWTKGLFSLAIDLPWTNFGKALRARQGLLKYIKQIIETRKQAENWGEDALGILLQAKDEEGNSLLLEELQDQILTLLFAGYETLTSSIASFCLLTAQNPNILQKLRQEQALFNYDLPLTLESLKEMTYLDKVLQEVLRLIPSVGGGFRKVIQDCEWQGYSIPKDWSVQYSIVLTHEDGEAYPNPQRFDPDRIPPERNKPFSYLPFGGGMRECIGKEFARLEMKIFAALLLRGYDWQLESNQDLSMKTIPTPRPKDGLKVVFSALS